MFGSQVSLSRKGPLGAIWVAAYCYRKLKKTQVTQTDISSSVDKILQDEFDFVTYRVLAHLLLGIVRIYSKKVEYMFSDCNNVLLKIKEFLVSNKDGDTLMETLRAPYFAITLPERFELDAFDLEILDDTSGRNLVPQEEITLKDAKWKSSGAAQSFGDQYHFEQLAMDAFSQRYRLNEDVHLSDLMDFDMELGTSHNESNSQAIMGKLQCERFSQHQPTGPVKSSNEFHQMEQEHTRTPEIVDSDEICVEVSMKKLWDDSFYEEAGVNIETFSWVQEEPVTHTKHVHGHQQTDAGQVKVPDTVHSENEVNKVTEKDHYPCNGEASIENPPDNMLTEEECMNSEMFGVAKEPVTPAKPVNVNQQTDDERIKIPDTVLSENEMNKVINEDYTTCDAQTNMENLRDKLVQEECINKEVFCMDEEPPEYARPSGEEQQSEAECIQVVEMTSSAHGKHKVVTEDQPFSTTPNAIRETKLPDVLGTTTPEFMVIPTPATNEDTWIPRKRKCLFDNLTVFPNDFMKWQIEDPSGLVSKRRKAPCNALAAWKSDRISNLPHSFLEPLIPYSALELRSLFCKKKLKIPVSVEAVELPQKLVLERVTAGRSAGTVEPLEELDILESHTTVRSKQTVDHLEKLTVPESPSAGGIVEAARPLEKLDISKSPTVHGSSVQMPIAPETPTQCRTTLRLFESPERPQFPNSDRAIPEFESIEKETSPCKDQQLDHIEKETSPCKDQQLDHNQPSPNKDQELDHNLMNEVINSSEGDDQDHHGWSERTRMVARLLERNFLNLKRREEEEELISLSQLLEGKNKKESAIIFYEVLVLKSKGYVHVEQENSYSDIHVRKTSQWHEACGTDGL